jgi:CBS domain-containing protein
MGMETVKQLLEKKGHEVWTVTPETSVFDAVKLMADKNVGALVVVQVRKAVGLISEREYSREVVLKGRSSKTTAVRDIMTSPVLYARPDQTVEDCMALVTEKRTRHLPVLDGEELIGIVSIGDLVKAVISHQQFIIEQLEHYITR